MLALTVAATGQATTMTLSAEFGQKRTFDTDLSILNRASLTDFFEYSEGKHMAGASAEVLLRNPISEVNLGQLKKYLELISSEFQNRFFWVAGQPFIWEWEKAANDEWDTDVLGWSPQGAFVFSAMSRNLVSEAYLAMLISRVAQMFDGVIALGGHIDRFAEDGILVMEGRYKGKHEDYVTPAFLHYWIGHPKFRMVN